MLQGIVLLPCLCSAKTKQMPLCLSLARAEVIFIGGGGGGLIRRGTASSLRVRLLSLLHLFNVCG